MSSQSKSTSDAGLDTSSAWPPGTVHLEHIRTNGSEEIILQPRPTEDPNDPLNWSIRRKYLNFGLACLYVIMVNEFINVATPTWGPMHKELGFSYEVLNNSYAVGCACLGIGAVLFVPFALKFGRRPVYVFSTIVQFGLCIWSAKMQTVADIMLINAIQCLFGSLTEVIVQMTVSDLFFVHQRGTMNSIYVWIFKLTASLGPLIAGYITRGQGWRWVWWWNAIFFAVCILIVGFGYEETKYCPSAALTESPESNEQDRSSDMAKTAVVTENPKSMEAGIVPVTINNNIPMKTYWQRLAMTTPTSSQTGNNSFLRHMYQPFILLGIIPAVAYTALVYGILVALGDVMSTTQSTFLPQPPYNFKANQIGLMYLPKIIGITIGALTGGPVSDWIILYLSRRNKGIYEPEFRLWAIVPFVLLVPAGAFMFGMGLNNGLPWPVMAVGFGLYNAGVAPINSIVITYLNDSYKDIIGDALVGVTIIRNTFSTAFIFALHPWIDAIGIKYVFVAIVMIAAVILLAVGIFIKWGKNFRVRCAPKYQFYALRQYKERVE